MNWNFFDLIYVLNTPSAVERMKLTVAELQRVGCSNFTRFEALPDIGPHQSFNRSIKEMLLNFYRSKDYETLLILEDDVVFGPMGHLEKALNSLPDNWDICYLGANLQEKDFKEPEYYNPLLCRVYNAWTTHAISIHKRAVKRLIVNQPGFSDRMFDNWLSSVLGNFNAYCVSPMVAYQRPGKSLIWNSNTNYHSIFTKSNLIMANQSLKHT